MNEPVPSRRATRAPHHILLADPSSEARSILERALSGLGPVELTHATSGDELEKLFFGPCSYDLVVCRALLGARSGLQVLVRAREAKKRAAFIVYSSLDGPWLRAFVSDADSTVLSSRVVSLEGMAQLAEGILLARRR